MSTINNSKMNFAAACILFHLPSEAGALRVVKRRITGGITHKRRNEAPHFSRSGESFVEENRTAALTLSTTGPPILLQERVLPPDFWAWNTAPPPGPPPGPYPDVAWVVVPPTPEPTPAPQWQACYGCDCLLVDPRPMVSDLGELSNDFSCIGGAPTKLMPALQWTGAPINSGQGHPLINADNLVKCPKSLSFAIVVEDLDYPNGVGEVNNSIRNKFWAVNIPGDRTSFDESAAQEMYREQKLIHVGRNDDGKNEMSIICPKKGLHRYRFTLWSLKDYVSTGDDPLPEDAPYSSILPKLEALELQKASFYATVTADPSAQ